MNKGADNMWNYKRTLSIFLIATFISSNMPIPTLAQGIENLTNKIVSSAQLERNSKKEAKILQEVESKREKYVKHFIKEDKTFEAVVYPFAAHYKENGKWMDIDNNIIEGKDDENNDVLENKSNDFKVEFGKKSDARKLVSIKKDGYEISWNINKPSESDILSSGISPSQTTDDTITTNALNSTSTVENNTVNPEEIKIQEPVAAEQTPTVEKTTTNSEPVQESTVTQSINNNLLKVLNSTSAQIKPENTDYLKDLSENDKKKTLTNLTSTVEFKDIYQDVNLEYEVRPEDVKETIVINKNTDNTYFEFNINSKNLTAKLQADKSIIFYDAKDSSKEVFAMDAPYMIDAKNQQSKDIEIGLTQTKAGYILSLKPNKEWLDSSERVYPIKIDPTVTTNLGITSIHDTFVSSSQPTTNYYNNQYLETGYGSITGKTRTYMQFDLPVLTSADMVTSAQLGLTLATNNTNLRQVNAYRASGNWDSKTLTWNNQPGYDWTVIQDFQMVQNVNQNGYLWDVTASVKDWYNTGNNYGIVLQHENEGPDCGYNEFVSSDTAVVEGRPRITIQYTNNSGIEDNLTYHSQRVGRAGTGYVNDYNGNLVFKHDDLSMNGNKMPVSLNHVFNSNEKDISKGYGLGWRLNLSQRVVIETIGIDKYYVYTDEDGTKNYFKDDGATTLKDESGIDLTLTVNPDKSYIIKDKGGNELGFVPGGYLYTIKDNNKNTLTLNYNGTTLAYVTDGAGRVSKLESTAEGYLTGIVDPSGRRTSFSYDGIKLSRITYPDGKYTLYTYDSNNNLNSAINFDGYKMQYIYYPSSPYRVQQIHESNVSPATDGQGINIVYGLNTTIYNDFRGKKNIYQFNNTGNTISVRDDEGNAKYYNYNEGPTNKNKLQLESKLQKSIMNLLKNHNAEGSSDWTSTYWTTSTGLGSYDTTNKYLGNQSLKISKTNSDSRQFYNQQLTLEKGKIYTLSGYVKADNISNSNGKGASIFVNYYNESGVLQTVDSSFVRGTKDWDRNEVTFTLPANASSTTVYARAGIAEETGTAYFDCMQLEDGSAANRYNLIENPNLIYGSDTPDFWTKNNECTTSDTLIASTDTTYPTKLDNTKKVFRLTGSADKNKSLYQKINVSSDTEDTFVVSGWANGNSVALSGTRYFALDVAIEKMDGSYSYQVVPFNEDSTDWQYVSAQVKTGGAYKSINVYALYYGNENSAEFDGVQLFKEQFGTSYQYDGNGNPTTTTDVNGVNSAAEYDANNDLVKTTSANGNISTNAYDADHNIDDATSPENVTDTFTYDGSGNPLTTTTKGSNATDPVIKSSSTYTPSGNYLKSETDPSGNTVNSNYNETKGTLDSVTDSKSNTVFNSYDEMDKLTGTNSIASSSSSEIFPLSGTTNGTKGTKPISDSAVYAKDENGKTVLSANGGTKTLYNLGLSKTAGTMSAWTKSTGSSTTRYLFTSQGSNSELLCAYIDTSNKVNVAVRDTLGAWETVVTSTAAINTTDWNFIALEWKVIAGGLQCTLYLNGASYVNTAASYKDFTGVQTSVGSYIDGNYAVNGLVDEYIYSNIALGSTSILNIYNTQRGKYLDASTVNNKYSYENDRIKSVSNNGSNYTFNYDGLGNNTKVNVGTQNLITNNYEARTGKLLDSTYGNGQIVGSSYDSADRVISSTYNGLDRFKYGYDASGNVASNDDLVNGVNYKYIYDMSNRLVKIVDSKGNTVKNIYDVEDNLSSVAENLNGVDYTTSYTYDKENKPKTTTYKGNVITNNYDSLGRLQGKVTNTGTAQINTSYEFEAGKDANTTTNRVSKITNNGNGIVYSYDKNGNIETITENGKLIKYYYNELNELIREDNQVLNKTISYSYDNGGNILNKVEYAYTTGTPGIATKTSTYTYGDANWKDKLTSFNDGTAKPITYDAIGNPLTYNGYIYTWEEGRQLAALSGNGDTIAYKYNDSGIRTQKIVNGVTTTFHLAGDKVTYETNGTDNIYYTYDSSEQLVSMSLNGGEYYYIRNTQGDIIGLHDSKGAEIVSYSYDSWGKLISTTGTLASTVGVKNPYRYRGYRYDTETSLYYLQSRYYNAEWGRFVNGDATAALQLAQGKLLGANLFSYCINNPVMNSDPTGHWSWNYLRSKDFLVPLFNLIIFSALGIGTVKIASLYRNQINKIGKQLAEKTLKRAVRSALKQASFKASAITKITGLLSGVFSIASYFTNPGGVIFNLLNSKDKIPNNKYLDF
ncbi:DNRLRE domain-containing protein [Clostridium estertheticum]|uniref:DNRLRE domain-containing protein n=1 Tax=Clostridium estertheticum TaxID=238834 RepID=UPI001CD08139|nr:DNRLRE domain-containing protein [Clostridium estertheticum]MBZ9686140.1 DNRLRE domain-containing protein [Clostridium estertheticum]